MARAARPSNASGEPAEGHSMNLSSEQARAVESPERHKRVIAAAGSGKTRVIVAQAGAWLRSGASAGSTAVISFTRRSGEELRRRIGQEHRVDLGYVGTVHGMAYLALALADDGRHRLTPLVREECDAVVNHVAGEARLTSALAPKIYKAVQGKEINLATLTRAQAALLAAICGYMEGNRMVHVGALVARFVQTMQAAPAVRDWFRAHARTILWDEYQDTTVEEAQVLAMALPDRSLVVGDPRQAIFGFRHASDEHLYGRAVETFDVRFNFRSGSRILAAANCLHGRRGDLVAFRSDPGEVVGLPCEQEEVVSHVADAVAAMEARPVHILCRTNREVAQIQDALARRGVCAVAASPHFDRFASPPWAGLFLACRYLMDPRCEWLVSAMARAGVRGDELAVVDPEVETAGELLARISQEDAQALGHEAVLGMTVVDFLAWYQRRDLHDLLPGEGEADAVVMTAHASKGLEFDTVVLADVGRRLGGDDDKEERNLLYVAITRARERLVMVGDPETVARLAGER